MVTRHATPFAAKYSWIGMVTPGLVTVAFQLPTGLLPTPALAGTAVAATTAAASTTTVEWPSEKNSPTESGRCPFSISLRTTLSIAAIWSASTAWRSPNT